MELDSRPGSRRATAPANRAGSPSIPLEFVVAETASVWASGYNKHGELGKGDVKLALALCPWPSATLERHRLPGRIESITLGWYHGIICVAPRWRAPLPPIFTHSELMNEGRMGSLELAGLLLEWASTEFKRTLREGGIPDDAAILSKAFSRIELASAYLRMLETGQHGSLSSVAGVYSWGLNAGGQLGLGDNLPRAAPVPVMPLVGRRVALVACGGYHTLLLMEDGALLAFGDNRRGQLGNGTRDDSSRPQLVPALSPAGAHGRYGGTHPSRVLRLLNLNPFVTEFDVRERLERCWGFLSLTFENADHTTLSSGNVPRPSVKAFFRDPVSASEARRALDGKPLNARLAADRLRVEFVQQPPPGRLRQLLGKASPASEEGPNSLLRGGRRVAALACGFDHCVAVLSDGTAAVWGGNLHGQLGLPLDHGRDPEEVLKTGISSEDVAQLRPVLLPFALPASAAPTPHALIRPSVPWWAALRRGWPAPPPAAADGGAGQSSARRLRAAVCGGNHTLLVDDSGRLYSCGRNDYGQLGLGPLGGERQYEPTPVRGVEAGALRSAACGASHSLALMRDGGVLGWGRNDRGQLGLPVKRAVRWPEPLAALSGRPVAQVAAGEHTLVTFADGGVVSFGSNAEGQLCAADPAKPGAGGAAARRRDDPAKMRPPLFRAEPGAVQGLPEGVRALALCGAFHTLLAVGAPMAGGAHLREECAAVCGYNKHGELGLGFMTPAVGGIAAGAKVPTLAPQLHGRGLRLLACGWYHTVFVEARGPSGRAWSFGYNKHGQLGQGHADNSDSPAEVLWEPAWGLGQRVAWVACGGYTSYLGTDSDETWAWGSNLKGALGLGRASSEPVLVPTRVAALCGRGVERMSCGFDHALAVAHGGAAVYGLGGNEFGQLGLGDGESIGFAELPMLVRSLSGQGLADVQCGGNHTVALLPRGRVLACGRNDFGQCGLGTRDARQPALRDVSDLARLPAKRRVVWVACGASHTLFGLSSGEVAGCGRNDTGQLGAASGRDAVPRPMVVIGQRDLDSSGPGARATRAACGEHSMVVLSTGAVVAAGSNHNGQLGIGTTETDVGAGFVQTLIDGRGVTLHAGAFHTLAHYSGNWAAESERLSRC